MSYRDPHNETRNYINDPRVANAEEWRPGLDERRMMLAFEIEECECDECLAKLPPFTVECEWHASGDHLGALHSWRVVTRGEVVAEFPITRVERHARDDRGLIPPEQLLEGAQALAEADAKTRNDAAGYVAPADLGVHRYEVPARFVVCPSCDGKGSHVNPAIDCGGLSREDFDDDPDFEEGYVSGNYDVQCYTCHGKRVIAVANEGACTTPAQKKALAAMREREEDEADYAALRRAERSMGA